MGRKQRQLPRIIRRIRPAFSRYANGAAIFAIAHSIRDKGFDAALEELQSETLRLRLRLVWERRMEEFYDYFGHPDHGFRP